MLRKVFILVFIFVLASLAVSAQLDDDANACNEGGTMEGKCDGDVNGDGEITEDESDWAWRCGWYMARYNVGEYSRSQVPVECHSLLPAEVEGGGGGADDGTDYCVYPYDDGTFRLFFFNGTEWIDQGLQDGNKEGYRECGDGDDIPV